MASEAVMVMRLEPAINFTCANGTGIEKGAILKNADPMTASLADGDEDYVAGIAANEKIASDGKTKIGVYRRGIFRIKCSGAVTCGQTVSTWASTGATNVVAVSTATSVSSKTLGIALQTAAEGESVLIEVNPGVGANAFS